MRSKVTPTSFFIIIFLFSFSAIAQTTIILQPGPIDGKTTIVVSQYPNGNFNPDPHFRAYAWTSGGVPIWQWTYMQFDMSAIPTGAIIRQARLSLYTDTNYSGVVHSTLSGSNESILLRVTSDWDKKTITWNNQPTVTTVNQVILPASTSAYQDYTNIDVKAIIQDMVNKPDSSFGFKYILQNSNYYRSMNFAGSDYTDPTRRPKLEITFSMPQAKNIITGKIFNDANNDCIKDPLENGLRKRIVKAEPGPSYGFTDSLGNYSIYVDTGHYMVTRYIPENWNSSCPQDTLQVYFPNDSSLSLQNNFGEYVTPFEKLTVDVSPSSEIRNCFKNNYTVSYCNEGTVNENNVVVTVEFPSEVVILNATLPHTMVSNKCTFNVGTLTAGSCGFIQIQDSISCPTPIGKSICVNAGISPVIPPANPSASWDKSSIVVSGSCQSNSIVHFEIKNDGEDMADTSEYRIYINNELYITNTFRLQKNEILPIDLQGQGLTIRLEADQRPFHPGHSHPRASVEACGLDSTGNIELGFISQVQPDNENDNIITDCRTVVGSFDPNEKSVIPSGITANHYVPENSELEYRIDFQNTGTDTAQTVVIRDTLSINLDVSTIKAGLGSHPYSFNISGSPLAVAEFTFKNIALPDSNVNEPASHGFVKFKVRPLPGTAKGTVIKNLAAIYFDFNAPVITNTTVVTLKDTVIMAAARQGIILGTIRAHSGIQANVFPNPFHDKALVSISTGQGVAYNLEIYDLAGNKIRSELMSNTDPILERKNLSNGTYILKIISSDGSATFRKIVVD